MALTINFREKYRDLINPNIPKHQLKSIEDRGGYLDGDTKPCLPEEYRRKAVHPPEGFVALYCEEY